MTKTQAWNLTEGSKSKPANCLHIVKTEQDMNMTMSFTVTDNNNQPMTITTVSVANATMYLDTFTQKTLAKQTASNLVKKSKYKNANLESLNSIIEQVVGTLFLIKL